MTNTAISTDDIIKNIIQKKLPLSPEELQRIKTFCDGQRQTERFRVLGEIPKLLRRDWLDQSLDETLRGSQHINVRPAEWRQALENQCDRTIKAYMQQHSQSKVLALLMWRAGLAYLPACLKYGISVYHLDVKRDEATLKASARMPLNEKDETNIQKGSYDQILVPDPMLASGASMVFTIDLLKDLGVPEDKIILPCVVAAPEGVSRILNIYPEIKIIAASLDDHLDKNAYIQPGLGDAGDKFFCGNRLSNFLETRQAFTDGQWNYLEWKLGE